VKLSFRLMILTTLMILIGASVLVSAAYGQPTQIPTSAWIDA
jgi:hypothetical protein